ncbi:AAA family ATPase [Azospirillum soli]|uniref:AAA family ATPase n=1 Tax=Azospirillum soli TaxID=1304799 RepID=UPI001AE4B220|nr:AAA family ATPase [Azospirillum soli]MBP2316388.1 exonuclease SbcC [Azospirillum soli]
MRILAVRGANLASLDGPFAVELDHGPLRQAGLFAITGPTGAGKSTILDALCLALFDRMPRLPDGRGVPLGREGDPDVISTTDVRTVLRRGAGACWAEVDFIGIDGAAYRARWELRRARQNARGKLQDQAMSLSSLDGAKRFGDGKTSVQKEIAGRLGLNFEQFRRAVLLAQGDFANFLKAPAKERSALLELLTGTEIYSRLSKAAHERWGAEQRALEALEAQCAGIGVLGDDERALLEADAATMEGSVRQGEGALEAARAAVAWHERDAQLARAEAEAAGQAAEAERVWLDAEPRRREAAFLRRLHPLRPLLAEADRCSREAATAQDALTRAEASVAEARQVVEQTTAQHADARRAFEAASLAQTAVESDLERAVALDQQIATLATEHADAASEAYKAEQRTSTLLNDWRSLEKALGKARREAAERERWLAGQAPFAPVAEQWARWDAVLVRHRDATRTHGNAGAQARRCAIELQEHEAELTRLGPALEEARIRHEAAERAQAAVQAEPMAALDVVSRRRGVLTARRDTLSALAGIAETAARLAREQAEAESERGQQAAAADAGDARAAETKARLDRRQAALVEAEGALRRFHLARRDDVESLRTQLVEGEACPVCGSADHPWATGSGPLARLADAQEERVAELRAKVTALVKEHGGHEASARAARERVSFLDTRLTALRDDGEGAGRRWAERAAGLDLPERPEPDAVAAQLAVVEAELAEVARDEAAALDHKVRLDAAAKDRRDGEIALADVTRTIEARTRQRDAARHAEALAVVERDRAARDRAEALAELAAPFAGVADWDASLNADPEGFRSATARRVAELLDQREAYARAVRHGDTLAATCATKAAELEGARQAEQAARRRLDGLVERLGALRETRAGLLGGRTVTAVKQELAEARQRAEALVDKATVARQNAATRLSAAEQDLATRGEAAQRCANAVKAADAALSGAAAERGVAVDEARLHLARSEDWLMAEEKALAALDQARRDAALLAAERTRLRGEHHAAGSPAATAEEARAAVVEAAQALQEARGRLGEARARLRADTENRGRLAAVLDQVKAQRKTHALWAGMARLIGSSDGQKMRNFAQSLSLDMLLVHANRHLEDLARRYRLERVAGADLEIRVVDREMGDERRGVHSLSGGEMFLVSLALALGLSAMAGGGSGEGIGTLFIDEGFGTLDPDSLDLALSCLETLQATGRQVGVISHVPTLVERIGVQVRIVPQGGGRSTLRVTQGGVTAPADRGIADLLSPSADAGCVG